MKKRPISSVFLTFAVDNLGATIVFPIFAPLFLDERFGLLGPGTPFSTRTILLGCFLGIFPLMQFLFAPVFGEVSDHVGRRKVLVVTTFLTFVGYFFSAWCIRNHYVYGLLFSRMLTGIGAANMAICLSALADVSETPQKRTRYYSLGSAIAGFTFVLGPYIGGKLSDTSLYSFFTIDFPMWVSGGFGVLNFLYVFFLFGETIHEKSQTKPDFLSGFHNLRNALSSKRVRNLFVVYFFYLFAWNVFFQFVPAFAVGQYQLSSPRIGDLCALMGLCWIFGTGVINKFFSAIHHSRWLLFGLLFLFAGFTALVGVPHKLARFIGVVGLATTVSGIIWPLATSTISSAAGKNVQGKVMGLSQSVLSLSMMLASILGGIFLQFHYTVPFIMGSAAAIISALWMLRT